MRSELVVLVRRGCSNVAIIGALLSSIAASALASGLVHESRSGRTGKPQCSDCIIGEGASAHQCHPSRSWRDKCHASSFSAFEFSRGSGEKLNRRARRERPLRTRSRGEILSGRIVSGLRRFVTKSEQRV